MDPSAPPPSGAAPEPAAPAATLEDSLFSITDHFNEGCNVLITGASGYIGSLILEKLLRSTRVGHVYLLLRPRRGVDPADRVAKLLQGPLFHLLDASEAARVSAVAGDILEPGLGLSPEDEAMLLEKVDTVIHSAAGAAVCGPPGPGRQGSPRRAAAAADRAPGLPAAPVRSARRPHQLAAGAAGACAGMPQTEPALFAPIKRLGSPLAPPPPPPLAIPTLRQTSASTRPSTTPCAPTTLAAAP
jgi:hypothetical protein